MKPKNSLNKKKIDKNYSSKNLIIFLASFASFLTGFSASVIAVALPSISSDFAINAITQNWLATSFLLSIAIFSLPFGTLSGKIGLKKFYVIGLILFIIGSIFASISFSATILIISRVIQGIAGAMLNVAGFAMITEDLRSHERGKAIGIAVASAYVGLTLAPVLGGILTHNLGWQSIFYIVIPIIIITAIVIFFKIKEEWVIGKNDPFDYLGSIIYSFGILLFMYGFTILNELTGVLLAVIGLGLLIGFGIWELKHKFPVFHVEAFKNIEFTSSTIASLISYLATFVVTYILNYHFQYIENMNPQTSGIILIVAPALMGIVAPFSGTLSDKINPEKLSAIGMALVAVSIFILIFLNKDTPLFIIILSMVIQGIGYGLFLSPNTNTIMNSAPKEYPSLASATISTVRVVGQTMSLGILTVVFAVVMGSVSIIPKYYPLLIQSSQIVCIISTILCLIAIVFSIIGSKIKIKT
ncbi:MAG: MFS transporter [Methanobacteriaceae archaeon]|nr:MFS transporter [Methanobacteriaceae archaeon]